MRGKIEDCNCHYQRSSMYGDGIHLGFVVHGYLLVEMKIDACTATIMDNSSINVRLLRIVIFISGNIYYEFKQMSKLFLRISKKILENCKC